MKHKTEDKEQNLAKYILRGPINIETSVGPKNLFQVIYSDEFCVDYYHAKHQELSQFGGYVETEYNLSQDGLCVISNGAMVFNSSVIYGNAEVLGGAEINHSIIGDAVRILNKTKIVNSRLSGQISVLSFGSIKNSILGGQIRIGRDVNISNVKSETNALVSSGDYLNQADFDAKIDSYLASEMN